MDERHYDTAAAKERLVRYRDIERDIDNQIERLEHLNSKKDGLGSQVITDMPKGKSISPDRISGMLARIEQMELRLRNTMRKRDREKQFLETSIECLDDPDERAVLQMRYLDMTDWNDINFALFGYKSNFEDKEDVYLRRAYRIHKSAIREIAMVFSRTVEMDEYDGPFGNYEYDITEGAG